MLFEVRTVLKSKPVNKLKKQLFFFVFLSAAGAVQAQDPVFTRQDTLRGSITSGRSWWDLTYYHLRVQVQPGDSSLRGSTVVRYTVLEPHTILQIDLQEPLQIMRVEQEGQPLAFERDGNAWLITLEKEQKTGAHEQVEVFYAGKPRVAVNPPWDGGVQWEKDVRGNWLITTSCQGLGASVWWPCKDHMYDEPDSMLISVTVPDNLTDVSNGRLRSVEKHSDGTQTFHWFVGNPINNYGVNLNVGNYVSWQEVFRGEKGPLDLSYYVLPDDLEKAKTQFAQVPKMLKAFEHWFGPYPFYEDGYKIVQVPYLGMEHQSSVTYGNQFMNGYLGRDLSNSGWGLKFDFIIIHESGHEWFANNITYRDIADMWIHESFTNYSESLYVEYYFGKKAASEYVIGTRSIIQNKAQVMGIFGVNHRGSGDMYAKGGNMLHMIRQVLNNDEKWRGILRGLNREFRHATVEGKAIIRYINSESGTDFTPVFRQYLEDIRIPVLEYGFKKGRLHYRWANVVDDFAMPVKVSLGNEVIFLKPTTSWKQLRMKASQLTVDPNFYVSSLQVDDL